MAGRSPFCELSLLGNLVWRYRYEESVHAGVICIGVPLIRGRLLLSVPVGFGVDVGAISWFAEQSLAHCIDLPMDTLPHDKNSIGFQRIWAFESSGIRGE